MANANVEGTPTSSASATNALDRKPSSDMRKQQPQQKQQRILNLPSSHGKGNKNLLDSTV